MSDLQLIEDYLKRFAHKGFEIIDEKECDVVGGGKGKKYTIYMVTPDNVKIYNMVLVFESKCIIRYVDWYTAPNFPGKY